MIWSFTRVFTGPVSPAMAQHGFTEETKKAWADEVANEKLDWTYIVPLYFVWARKRVDGAK